MAEVISAYPLAGGVYSWSLLLIMAWINGYAYLIGLETVTITLAWTSCQFIFAISNTLNLVQVSSQSAYVGLYVALMVLGTLYNLLGIKYSTYLNKFMVIWVLIGSLVIIVGIPALAPTHKTAKWVFTEFSNNTGYSNNGMVFLIGLLQAGWALVGYECGAQIVEGTKNAATTAPRGIIICVLSAIFQGFVLIISTLFSIQDVDELLTSEAPVATFFLRATSNPSVTAFFLVILLVAQIGSLCNSILAAAHIAWAMARDGCLPFSKFLYKLSGDNHIAANCLIVQLVICILIILPSFASTIYWQAIMSTAVISVNISYGLPLLCRLIWTRNKMPKGPFSLGKFGLPLNAISVAWIVGRAYYNCRCRHSDLGCGYVLSNYSKHSVDCIRPTFVLIPRFTAFLLAVDPQELPCIDTRILPHAFHVSLDFTPELFTGRVFQSLKDFTRTARKPITTFEVIVETTAIVVGTIYSSPSQYHMLYGEQK
ncbi:hypothetical protein G6F70_006816 [Rhizopus microsporus]|nr:hypothetical protein G6F71_006792 [Rhizopus microsporus]KAG1197215.1 hypothetical protein G6F70_006816 [Rhizopus microsporus]KAG1216384.1 hypothetical protein G6F69_000146 [Rhizopus microsporus]KAG1238359.1 hypothetical protein G6F67_000446 [Rhizopus microsporus]KAG1267719.1 hypothetical protein G6F68_001712 [Rhizopus microsporus]